MRLRKAEAPIPPKAPEPAQKPRALTAAAVTVSLGNGSSWKTWRFGNSDWQTEAWRLYDIVPELHKLAGRIGDSIAKARLYVTEVDENGEEVGETKDAIIANLAALPLGTGATRDANLRLAGVDLAVGGEAWMVGEGAARDPLGKSANWFVVTGAGLKRENGQVKVRRPRSRDGGWLSLRDGTDVLIRGWGEHPNDPDQADSFTRAAIVPLREIELLTKREFAELDSRLTGAGMLPLPEGIDFPHGADEPADLNGFMAYAQRAAAMSMQDQSTAAAMVPIMFTVPDHMFEQVKDLKPITFWSELSAEIGPMKSAAIERFANTAEIPGEVLTGIGSLNHWSGWLVTEEGTRWIGRYLSLIADALTRGFLRLALAKMGKSEEEISRFAFAFDTSALAARPNRIEDATVLHDRFLLSDEAMVQAAAFDPEQMPSVAERAQQILLKLITVDPNLITDPGIQRVLGLPEVERVSPPTPEAISAPDEDPGADSDGPPQDDRGNEGPRALTAALDARIAALRPGPEVVFNAACKLIVYRALELAGGRLATPAERRGRWADVPRHELHFHVGPITPAKAADVTAGAWGHVAVTAADLGVDAGDLQRLLSGYVSELLTRGIRHHDDLLFAALNLAHRGRGLMNA